MRVVSDGWVLVTGGRGFVGGALVRRLLGLGHDVRVVSRSPFGGSAPPFAARSPGQGRLEWFEGDVRRPSTIRRAFDGVRHAFHAAALVDSAADADEFERANVQATANVCELALRAGVERLVYVGTSDVFGLPRPGETITERTPFRRWGEPYPDTKIDATELVHGYRKRGLASAVVHPGWVYGPGDRAFLPALVRQIATGILPLWGPAGSRINLVYVEDLVDALVTAADSPAACNEDFLVLDEASDVGMDDLCRRAASFLGLRHRPVQVPYALAYAVAVLSQQSARLGLVRRPPFTTTDVRSFGHRFRFSTAKARRRLAWSPRTPFRDGIDAALRWYLADTGGTRRAGSPRVERHAGPGSRPGQPRVPASRRRPSTSAQA